MNCCMCSGSCNHVGNHTYCDAHKANVTHISWPIHFEPTFEYGYGITGPKCLHDYTPLPEYAHYTVYCPKCGDCKGKRD